MVGKTVELPLLVGSTGLVDDEGQGTDDSVAEWVEEGAAVVDLVVVPVAVGAEVETVLVLLTGGLL